MAQLRKGSEQRRDQSWGPEKWPLLLAGPHWGRVAMSPLQSCPVVSQGTLTLPTLCWLRNNSAMWDSPACKTTPFIPTITYDFSETSQNAFFFHLCRLPSYNLLRQCSNHPSYTNLELQVFRPTWPLLNQEEKLMNYAGSLPWGGKKQKAGFWHFFLYWRNRDF